MPLILQKTLTNTEDPKKGILCALEFQAYRGYYMTASSCSIVGHLAVVSLFKGDRGDHDLVSCDRQSKKKEAIARKTFEEKLVEVAEKYCVPQQVVEAFK